MLGEAELDDLLSARDKLNARLQEILDAHTGPWGIKVSQVEIKDRRPPSGDAARDVRQAEAEREKRAKVIHAEGEYQASERLLAAARVIAVGAGRGPVALSSNADGNWRRAEHDCGRFRSRSI